MKKTLSILIIYSLLITMLSISFNTVYAEETTENDKFLSKLYGYDLENAFKKADSNTLFNVQLNFIVDSGELKTFSDYLVKNPNAEYKQYRELVNKYNDDLALSYGIDAKTIIGHTRIPGEIRVRISKAKLQSLLEVPSLYFVLDYKKIYNMNAENYIEDGLEIYQDMNIDIYLNLSTGKYYKYDLSSQSYHEWLGANNYYTSTAVQNITFRGREYVVNHSEMTIYDKDGNKDEFLTESLISAWKTTVAYIGFCEYRKIVFEEESKYDTFRFTIYCFDDIIGIGDIPYDTNELTCDIDVVIPYAKFYSFGDVNLSSEVNMEDVTAMQKYIANLPCKVNEFIADFDYDNKLTMLDVVALQRKIAKL